MVKNVKNSKKTLMTSDVQNIQVEFATLCEDLTSFASIFEDAECRAFVTRMQARLDLERLRLNQFIEAVIK